MHPRSDLHGPAHRLAMTAVAGIVSGLGGSCATPKPPETAVDIPKLEVATDEPTENVPTTPRRATPVIAVEQPASNCCKGRNECKGLGNCKVEGAQDCKGKNDCKAKGGCRAAHCDEPNPNWDRAGSNCCKGFNDCKALGNCKTAQHACKGMNACKGQGGCKSAACP